MAATVPIRTVVEAVALLTEESSAFSLRAAATVIVAPAAAKAAVLTAAAVPAAAVPAAAVPAVAVAVAAAVTNHRYLSKNPFRNPSFGSIRNSWRPVMCAVPSTSGMIAACGPKFVV